MSPTEPDVMERERNTGHDKHQITLRSVNYSHVHGCVVVQCIQDNPAVCCGLLALGCGSSGAF